MIGSGRSCQTVDRRSSAVPVAVPQLDRGPVTIPTLKRATEADRDVLDRLWQTFRQDMSKFNGSVPSADGSFRSERLHAAITDPRWAAFIVELNDRAVGLAIVRALDEPVRVLNGFFIDREARRQGIGMAAVQQLLDLHPGQWEVAFQTGNSVAGTFWRQVAAWASDEWTEERRPVPDRADVPADSWIRFSR